MQPKTLEEALAMIAKLSGEKEKLLGEKKDLVKLFDDKDREDMTDMEKKMADILEKETAKRTDLEKQIEADRIAKETREADQAKAQKEASDAKITERIAKVSKGDKEVEKKLMANVALLDKLPRSSDADIDAVVNMSYNLMGAGSVNPLSAVSDTGGGTSVELGGKDGFAETTQGKALGSKLGLSFAKEAPAETK